MRLQNYSGVKILIIVFYSLFPRFRTPRLLGAISFRTEENGKAQMSCHYALEKKRTMERVFMAFKQVS